MKKLKMTIVSTRVRSFVVRNANSANSWCPVCQNYELMVSPATAAVLHMQTVRTIFRWLEAGKLHCVEEATGLLICLASLRPQETEALIRR